MYQIIIQHVADKALAPTAAKLRQWATAVLTQQTSAAEITIRIVDIEEMTKLNSVYRHKEGPTNVLSFPFTSSELFMSETPYLGDIVICSDVVNQEAIEQGKPQEAHWAHMIVHGIFHLLDYDHETENQAAEMEALEIKALQHLGFPNPYLTGDDKPYHD